MRVVGGTSISTSTRSIQYGATSVVTFASQILSHLCNDRAMRFWTICAFVLTGVVTVIVHLAVHLAGGVVKHALGGHYVTVWAGIFLIAGIWEVARPRTKDELRRQGRLVEPPPVIDASGRFFNRFDRPRSDPSAGSVRVER